MISFLFQGIKAIHSPHTGIIDYKEVTKSYGKNFTDRGGNILTEFAVNKFDIAMESTGDGKDGLKYPITIKDDRDKVYEINIFPIRFHARGLGPNMLHFTRVFLLGGNTFVIE